MDNTIPLPAFPATCVIKLNQFQYTFYQNSRLEIRAPNNKALTIIGKPLPCKTDEDVFYQLWAQACLLDVLLDQMQENVKLPAMAINSIAHVIGRIDGHIKKQLSM